MTRSSIATRTLPDGSLHVEAPGVTINVTAGLHDAEGHEVTHVSVSANGDRYAGERPWWVAPDSVLDRSGVGLRIVREG